MTGTANGFDMRSVTVEGRRRTVARFTCVECADFLDVTVDPGVSMNAHLPAIHHIAARPNYAPSQSLGYFGRAIREGLRGSHI